MPTYLISMAEDEMVEMAEGADALDAVASYYADQDRYCAPSDEITAEALVSVLPLPEALVDEACEILSEPDDDTADRIGRMVRTHGLGGWETLEVSLAEGEWKVSRPV